MTAPVGSQATCSTCAQRVAAWLTIVLCVFPLTAFWSFGALATTSMSMATIPRAVRREPAFGLLSDDVLINLSIWLGLLAAALGLAALFSALLPYALGKAPATALRTWQLLGLRLGILAGIVLLPIVWTSSSTALVSVSAALLLWPMLAAFHVTEATGQRLIPWWGDA